MFEPLRFLHVADIGLDRPVEFSEPVSAELKRLAEDASLKAFERMIAEAISRKVDCVLLVGNTFREADRSLAARNTLLEGLHQLDAANIGVFVLPGEDDPEPAWRDIPGLPSNVTVLTANPEQDDPDAPVAIMRSGRVIATVIAGTLRQLATQQPPRVAVEHTTETNEQCHQPPFRIGLLTSWPLEEEPTEEAKELSAQLSACHCDYLAVPVSESSTERRGWHFEAGQSVTTRDGIAHHPGRLQAVSERETGPHGGTLIEVNQKGEIRGTFLPFAVLRRLRWELTLEPGTTLESLIAEMQAKLVEETPQPGEQAWAITWVLQGSGPFFGSLSDAFVQSKLRDALPAETPGKHALPIHHHLQLQVAFQALGDDEDSNELLRRYRDALEQPPAAGSKLQEILAEMDFEFHNQESDVWQDRLAELLPTLDPQEVMSRARQLGEVWLSGEEARFA